MNLYGLPPLLSLAAFLGLAVLSLRLGLRNRLHRLFAAICVLGTLLYADILAAFHLPAASAALWVSRIDHLFVVFLPALYVHFFHEYLDVRPPRLLLPGAYAFSLVLMAVVPTPLYISGMERHAFGWYARGGPVYPVFGAAALAATVYATALLLAAIRREASGAARRRLGFVLAGFAAMGLLNSLNVIPSLGVSIYPPGCFSFLPLTVLYVGLFRHDLFDMGSLLRKGLTYACLTAALTAAYVLVAFVAGRGLHPGQRPHEGLAAAAAFFLLLALVFTPLKERTQRAVDRLLDRKGQRYRRILHRAGRRVAALRSLEAIGDLLTESVDEALRPSFCRLLLDDGSGGFASADGAHRLAGASALVERWRSNFRPLLRQRALDPAGGEGGPPARQLMEALSAEGAEAALPLGLNGRLRGMLLVGGKRSGTPYSTEDVELLETLVNQGAVAVEHALAHEALARLTRDLEQRVAERTAALAQALREKERSQERLLRSERLAAIGQLVAGTAHELNNPLAASLSLVQSAMEDLDESGPTPPGADSLREDLRVVSGQLRRAHDIVSSLLGLSRQNQEYTEAVNLTAVVRDTLRILRNELRCRGIRVTERFRPDLPEVEGNFAQVGQIVLNLVRNAVQASPPPAAELALSTDFDPETLEVVFRCRDFGCGVSEADRNRLFTPFFTTKPAGQGTGLGLYISHELARKHGGSLELADPGGKGAEFVLRLPVRS